MTLKPDPAESLCVSVIIKCLNEEVRVEAAIESALDALANVGGEVILADSLSTDRTIELAKKYPIKIVQLVDPGDRSCGAGPQLGYQHSAGKYIYILDADMLLHRDFIDEAVVFLNVNPQTAGVGGSINERNLDSLEYIARVKRNSAHMAAGEVDRLDMGGLYRREAIESVGYLSNRLLHSYEELDLAVRLRSAGWTLQRISTTAADHFGHNKGAYSLLLRRWQTRYINGTGEVFLYSLSNPWFRLLSRSLREAYLYIAFLSWNAVMIIAGAVAIIKSSSPWGALVLAVALAVGLPFLAFLFKKRNAAAGLYAYVSMAMNSLGFLRGLLSSRKFEGAQVKSVVLQTGPAGGLASLPGATAVERPDR